MSLPKHFQPLVLQCITASQHKYVSFLVGVLHYLQNTSESLRWRKTASANRCIQGRTYTSVSAATSVDLSPTQTATTHQAAGSRVPYLLVGHAHQFKGSTLKVLICLGLHVAIELGDVARWVVIGIDSILAGDHTPPTYCRELRSTAAAPLGGGRLPRRPRGQRSPNWPATSLIGGPGSGRFYARDPNPLPVLAALLYMCLRGEGECRGHAGPTQALHAGSVRGGRAVVQSLQDRRVLTIPYNISRGAVHP